MKTPNDIESPTAPTKSGDELDCPAPAGYKSGTLMKNETHDGEYFRCNDCGGKTMLVSPPLEWSVDQEPYKADEHIDHEDGYVEIREELSAHYCETCEKLTSLSIAIL